MPTDSESLLRSLPELLTIRDREYFKLMYLENKHISLGICPLCRLNRGLAFQSGESIDFHIKDPIGDPLKDATYHAPPVDPDQLVMWGEFTNSYAWIPQAVFCGNLSPGPGSGPNFSYFRLQNCNHHQGMHIFLDFGPMGPDKEILRRIGYPVARGYAATHFTPEFPITVPWMHRPFYPNPEPDAFPVSTYRGGGAGILELNLVDGITEQPYKLILVNYFFSVDWEKRPRKDWRTPATWNSSSPYYDSCRGFSLGVKIPDEWEDPFTPGKMWKRGDWENHRPFVEQGTLWTYEDVGNGFMKIVTGDWNSWPFKDRNGRKDLLEISKFLGEG